MPATDYQLPTTDYRRLCVIIDAHVHLFPPEVLAQRERYLQRDRWFAELYTNTKSKLLPVDQLLLQMDAVGVDRCVVVSFPWQSQENCEAHNGYFRQLGHRDRLSRLCIVQPSARERAVDELNRCLDAGFMGLGEMNVDAQGVELSDAELIDPLVTCLIDAGAALMVHCSEPVGHSYPGKGHNTPDKLYQFALAHPDLKIVGAHWGGGLPFYYLMPEIGPSLPNVYFDSAATEYLYDRRVFGRVIDAVGSGRVLFGSDFPLINQERALRHAHSAGLPPEAERAFFGDNAAAVYRR